jgi:hypothetical protein
MKKIKINADVRELTYRHFSCDHIISAYKEKVNRLYGLGFNLKTKTDGMLFIKENETLGIPCHFEFVTYHPKLKRFSTMGTKERPWDARDRFPIGIEVVFVPFSYYFLRDHEGALSEPTLNALLHLVMTDAPVFPWNASLLC